MHSSSRKVDETVSTLFTENKSSRFLKSASDVGFVVKVAVRGAEWLPPLPLLPLSVFCLLSFIFLFFFLVFKRNLLLNQTFALFRATGNDLNRRNLKASTPLILQGKKRKREFTHTLVTSRKRGSSTLKTEQYQYPGSASLIPSKQAVIGMLAVIFHVRLLISPLCSLIILSKHLNNVHDAAVKRVSYSPYTH